jgi:phage-related protein
MNFLNAMSSATSSVGNIISEAGNFQKDSAIDKASKLFQKLKSALSAGAGE